VQNFVQRIFLTDLASASRLARMPLTAAQYAKLTVWFEMKQMLERAKEAESKLRDELVKELFSADKDAGSETIEIANGYALKATKKLDYKLNNKEGQVNALIAIMLPEVANVLVKWEPKLSETAYKNADSETQKLFDGCLTIKPGKPSLEIIEPKAKQ
jgi:hypothetical protein